MGQEEGIPMETVQRKEETYLTRPFLVLSALNFLLYCIFYLQMMVAASYTMDVLKGAPWVAGTAAGIFLLSAMVARLYTGRYIEQVGKVKLMRRGTLFYLLVLPLYYFVDNAPFFIGLRLLHGIGLGIATSAIATIVVNVIPESRQGEGMSFYSLSAILAMGVGPMIGMFMYSRFGFRAILHLCLVLGVLSGIGVLTADVPDMPVAKEKLMDFGHGFASFFEKSALPISFVSMMMFFAYSSLSSYMVSYVREIQLVQAGSFFFLVYAILIVVSRPPMGRLFDKKGNKVILPAFVSFSFGMFLVSQARSSWVLLLAAAFIGFGFGNLNSLCRTIAVHGLPAHKLGLASSTCLAISELGTGFGPFILGILLPILGYRGIYAFLALEVLAGMGIYIKQYGLH